MQMLLIGLSFKNASINIREKVSFSQNEIENVLFKLKCYDEIKEIVILSTCNRTEFYIITDELEKTRNFLITFIEKEKNINFNSIQDSFYTYYNKFAAEHLYRVVSGIESLVLGEGEILRQVKDSFNKSFELGMTGKIFNALFKFAIETGKKIRTETSIAHKKISTGSVVAKIATDNFEILSDKTALLIGAGKISKITAKNLKEKGIGKIIIVNRSFEKADILAKELDCIAMNYENMNNIINEAHIIIVCTGAPEYLLSRDNYYSNKPVLLIDLSMPRNIEPELSLTHNINLYDLDSLEKIFILNKEQQTEVVKEIELILAEEMLKFVEWYNRIDFYPVISFLSSLFEELSSSKVENIIKKFNLDDNDKKFIDIVTKAIIQKIIHYPVTNLKMTHDKELKKFYSEVLTNLFQKNTELESSMEANIKLYQIDSTEEIIITSFLGQQSNDIEMILDQERIKFTDFYNMIEFSPLVSSLSNLFEDIRYRESEKTIRKYKLNKNNEKIIYIATKDIIQKIINFVFTNLKIINDENLEKKYSDALTYLFQLDNKDSYQKYFRKKENSNTVLIKL